MFLFHLGAGKKKDFSVRAEQVTMSTARRNWDDTKERGGKGITAVRSNTKAQEHRSCNLSGEIVTETEETKVYSKAAAFWHSYRETIKSEAHWARLKHSGGFCSCCFGEINRLKLKCAHWKELTGGFALGSYQHKCLSPAKAFPCKYPYRVFQITLALS